MTHLEHYPAAEGWPSREAWETHVMDGRKPARPTRWSGVTPRGAVELAQATTDISEDAAERARRITAYIVPGLLGCMSLRDLGALLYTCRRASPAALTVAEHVRRAMPATGATMNALYLVYGSTSPDLLRFDGTPEGAILAELAWEAAAAQGAG